LINIFKETSDQQVLNYEDLIKKFYEEDKIPLNQFTSEEIKECLVDRKIIDQSLKYAEELGIIKIFDQCQNKIVILNFIRWVHHAEYYLNDIPSFHSPKFRCDSNNFSKQLKAGPNVDPHEITYILQYIGIFSQYTYYNTASLDNNEQGIKFLINQKLGPYSIKDLPDNYPSIDSVFKMSYKFPLNKSFDPAENILFTIKHIFGELNSSRRCLIIPSFLDISQISNDCTERELNPVNFVLKFKNEKCTIRWSKSDQEIKLEIYGNEEGILYAECIGIIDHLLARQVFLYKSITKTSLL
jgi:hypothetical protein